MSAMHAGVMTTSTEMMYAQHVTLTYGKQREEGEAKREPERVRETKKKDRDKTRTAEEERNTATTHLSCTSLHGCVLLPLGVFASSVYVLAAAVRIIPYLWDGPALMCCCSPFRVFLFCCCCCSLLGLCRLMAVFFCEAGYVEIGLSSGGGRGWRDGVSFLSSSWF